MLWAILSNRFLSQWFGVSPSQELEEAVLQLETEMEQLLQCITQLDPS